jgi:hypothetical protein
MQLFKVSCVDRFKIRSMRLQTKNSRSDYAQLDIPHQPNENMNDVS